MDMEKEDLQLYQRPCVVGKAREKEEVTYRCYIMPSPRFKRSQLLRGKVNIYPKKEIITMEVQVSRKIVFLGKSPHRFSFLGRFFWNFCNFAKPLSSYTYSLSRAVQSPPSC